MIMQVPLKRIQCWGKEDTLYSELNCLPKTHLWRILLRLNFLISWWRIYVWQVGTGPCKTGKYQINEVTYFLYSITHSRHSHFKMEEWGHRKEGSNQNKTKTQETNIKSCAPCPTSGTCGDIFWAQVGLETITLHPPIHGPSLGLPPLCACNFTQQILHIPDFSSVLTSSLQLS